MKIINATLLVVSSMLLVAPEVHGQPRLFPKDITIFQRASGLINRAIYMSQPPTKSPTARPTVRPTRPPTVGPPEPTATPTESPAPSPSPSWNPTINPERITLAPSASPTASPAPSPSPSQPPTQSPSSAPSGAPTPAPTVSSAPSSAPTASPSSSPTDRPSSSPSVSPTLSAAPSAGPTISAAPSKAPTATPSSSPSDAPSDSPTMAPTSVAHRTKTTVVTLLLEEITSEMDRMMLAEFELFTLEFLRKKIPKSDEYVLNTVASTVLSQQNVVNPDLPTMDKPETRRLDTEDWTYGLEIDLRTVSVVTDGRVPNDFNLTEIVLYTFYDHWDQYLWQLGNSNTFFNPLVDVSEWTPVLIEEAIEKKKGKGKFVVSIMFSFVAFLLAVFASYMAIRKHLNKRMNGRTPNKKRLARGTLFSPKHSPKHYDVINYLATQTMSDDRDSDDDDVEGGGALGLVRKVNIDIDENGMESVILTPRANFMSPNASVRNGLFVVDEVSDDDQSPVKSPQARSPMADPSSASRIGGHIKKWLTPRGIMANPTTNNRLSSDPPDAVKASTKNYAGVFTTDKSTIDGRSKVTGISYNKNTSDEGQFTLPISFFSNRGTGPDESGVDSPMSSLADSNASSFFAIGNMNKSFAGQKNADEEYEIASRQMRAQNPSSKNDAPTIEDKPKVANENKPVEPMEEPIVPPPKIPSPSEQSAAASSVKLAAMRFERRQNRPLREVQPPSSTIGVETILGARSRDSTDDEDKRSNVSSSSFLKSRSIFSPDRTTELKKSYPRPPSNRYGRVNVEVQQQDARSATSYSRSVTSHSTLGARPMTRKGQETDDKSTVSEMSTLSSVMRRPGTYDVYAPSGPIGIVVDTSKHGPCVHSLKSTSPMLGLISPGDLIVALDGEDTRKMTAAALTRLMARKSRQKERKITLFS